MLKGLFMLILFPFTFMGFVVKATMYFAAAVFSGGRR